MDDNEAAKLKPGDVVYYADPKALCSEFRDKYGAGPFVLDRVTRTESGRIVRLTATTLDGKSKLPRDNSLPRWTHDPHFLTLDVFLTASLAAVKAIRKEVKRESENTTVVAPERDRRSRSKA